MNRRRRHHYVSAQQADRLGKSSIQSRWMGSADRAETQLILARCAATRRGQPVTFPHLHRVAADAAKLLTSSDRRAWGIGFTARRIS
jgi:hypothetical protein